VTVEHIDLAQTQLATKIGCNDMTPRSGHRPQGG
jgi:hypothetical protein